MCEKGEAIYLEFVQQRSIVRFPNFDQTVFVRSSHASIGARPRNDSDRDDFVAHGGHIAISRRKYSLLFSCHVIHTHVFSDSFE